VYSTLHVGGDQQHAIIPEPLTNYLDLSSYWLETGF
jgi:hypothetical protein